MSFEVGAAIGCGTGTAYEALRRMNVSAPDTVVIFGQEPVGLSATQFARAMNTRVIAVDTNEQRLEHARRLGADIAFAPSDRDAAEMILDMTDGAGVDKALDTSGAASARSAALRATKTWGTCCFVGEGGEVRINVSPELLRRQMTLIGSWTFSASGQAECAAFVASRGIDVSQIYTHRWTLDQAQQAYELFDQGLGGKGVFLM